MLPTFFSPPRKVNKTRQDIHKEKRGLHHKIIEFTILKPIVQQMEEGPPETTESIRGRPHY